MEVLISECPFRSIKLGMVIHDVITTDNRFSLLQMYLFCICVCNHFTSTYNFRVSLCENIYAFIHNFIYAIDSAGAFGFITVRRSMLSRLVWVLFGLFVTHIWHAYIYIYSYILSLFGVFVCYVVTIGLFHIDLFGVCVYLFTKSFGNLCHFTQAFTLYSAHKYTFLIAYLRLYST